MREINPEIAYAKANSDNPARSLPPALRLLLERAFGTDLSGVRLRTGREANRLARFLGADAFTFGPTIYFGDGALQPGTAAGQWLIAHEAAHVVQQAAGIASSANEAECERQADRAADLALAGGTWLAPVQMARERRAPLIQRHSSYEHRLLGDSPTSDLVAISTGAPDRQAILDNQIQLSALWRDHPDQVTPEQIQRLCPWIKTLKVGPDQVLATYGELNALPDYLSDAVAIDLLGSDILLPVLQVIRQENYNLLTKIATGTNPLVRFARSAAAPWRLNLVNNIIETTALDTLTQGLGPEGQNHYQGLLARNACHFAPFSWYRWQASYLIARDLAKKSYDNRDPELGRRALVYGGYADHFLEDSFAAGHLVNKTLVMQWFIEWAASQSLLPVADWDLIKYMTTTAQPSLMGSWLYDPNFQGPSNDPQTAQEAATLPERIIASGVLTDGPRGRFASYQNYLTFLTSSAAQLASAMLHDYYNENSLWVASAAQPTPYEIWGDDTLLTGRNGGNGVQATSETAQLSSQSLTELISTGRTSITTQQVRDRFPTQAGSSSTSLTDLRSWTTSQRDFCLQQFQSFGTKLKAVLSQFGSPRLGIASQDQEFVSIWSVSLPDSGYHQVDNLVANGRLFTGSNGYVYEIDQVSGKVIHELHLTTIVGNDVTHLATDGTFLFAGVHGYVYAIRLTDWSGPAWSAELRGWLGRVSVLYQGGRLYAGCDGYVYELRPADGSIAHELHLTTFAGDAETRISADGNFLYAGVHGYVYGVWPGNWNRAAWSTGVGGTGQFELVTVLAADGRLYAGSNGSVYQLQLSDGRVLQSKRRLAPRTRRRRGNVPAIRAPRRVGPVRDPGPHGRAGRQADDRDNVIGRRVRQLFHGLDLHRVPKLVRWRAVLPLRRHRNDGPWVRFRGSEHAAGGGGVLVRV